jgi:hypothetical protein
MAGNPDWQPPHDDPLFILAMDHRESFGKTQAARGVAQAEVWTDSA